MDVKIQEKTALAQRQFMEKASKLIANIRGEWQLVEVNEMIAAEYEKLYGRIAMHPLLSVKGGKKEPRYLIDRDETWVIYKPPLWQMAGSPNSWLPNVKKLALRLNLSPLSYNDMFSFCFSCRNVAVLRRPHQSFF